MLSEKSRFTEITATVYVYTFCEVSKALQYVDVWSYVTAGGFVSKLKLLTV